MKDFYFIGIDVSKKHLDCCLLFNSSVVRQDVISNHQKSIDINNSSKVYHHSN